MNYEFIIRVVLDLLIILIGLYLIFWKGYLNEKGKNYATKEDIEEITEKIETVKNEIGIHSQRKLEYLNDKKKAALDFLNSVSIWVDFTLRPLGILYNNPADKKIIYDLIIDLKTKGADATSNFWKMLVFFENENFTEVVDDLYNSCLKLHNLTNELLINLERNALEVERKLEIFDLVKDKNQKQEINEELKKLNQEINKLVTKFTKDKEGLDEAVTLSRYRYIKVLNKIFKIKTTNIAKP